MKLLLAGPIDGNIASFYKQIDKTVDWVLCTGNLGIWPDPARIDRATRLKSGPQDFAKLYLGGFQAPIQTLFVAGVHEDHQWLENRKRIPEGLEILPEINWLMNGFKTTIGDAVEVVRVTGFGKVYSESTFDGKLNKRSYRHFTRRELEKGCSSGPTDILLLHEAPSKPVMNLIYATRPKLIVHSAKESYLDHIQDIPTLALSRGDTVPVKFRDGRPDFSK
jgi:hypothetical protein